MHPRAVDRLTSTAHQSGRLTDLEGLEVGQGCLEVQGEGLAVGLPLMQGGLGVLQLPLGLVQPPPQLLHVLILAAQLALHLTR